MLPLPIPASKLSKCKTGRISTIGRHGTSDVILAPGFADWVVDNIHPKAFGKMPHALAQEIHAHEELTPASNRLEGLLVVPRKTFVELEGYDDILLGWGAGGDLDICDRLILKQQQIIILPETLAESTIHFPEDTGCQLQDRANVDDEGHMGRAVTKLCWRIKPQRAGQCRKPANQMRVICPGPMAACVQLRLLVAAGGQ